MFRDRLSKYLPMIKSNILNFASVASPVNHSDADVRFVGFVAMNEELAISDNYRKNIGFLDIGNVLWEIVKIF